MSDAAPKPNPPVPAPAGDPKPNPGRRRRPNRNNRNRNRGRNRNGQNPNRALDRNLNIFKDGEDDPLSSNSQYYPEWSWDNVRTYVAIRRGDKYSDDQIRALAAQDVVMLEKMNGHETYGSVEKGTLEAAKRIKGVNSKVTILFYLNAMVHYGGYAANKSFKNEWAMGINSNYKWREKWLSYDHTKPEFREWWIQRALDMAAHDEIDGIFIDGICKAMARFLPTKNHGSAYLATANELRKRLPEGKLLIGNALRASSGVDGNLSHMRYLDGSYLEGWAAPKHLEQTMRLMTIALKQGRIIMLNGEIHVNDDGTYAKTKSLDGRYKIASNHVDFQVGFFLLVAQPHAHLSLHVGVDGRPRAKSVFDNTRFNAVTRKLGKPMGNHKDEGNGVFSREFEHLKVQVDIKTMTSTLTVKEEEEEEEEEGAIIGGGGDEL